MIKAIGMVTPDPSLKVTLDNLRTDSDMRELFRLAAKYGRKLEPHEVKS